MKKLNIGITHGYTNGVSYEVILKAFEDSEMLELCTPILYGSPKLMAYHRKAMELPTVFNTIQNAEEAQEHKLNIIECFSDEVKVELGQETEEANNSMKTSMEHAWEDYKAGMTNVLITAPGDTEVPIKGLHILVNGMMRMAFVTEENSLHKISAQITTERLSESISTFNNSLIRDFGVLQPRIALLSLNNQMGQEEETTIKPAVSEAEEKGIQAFGPYIPEEFFGTDLFTHFDGILTMYYAQGIVPLKLLSPEYIISYRTDGEHICCGPLQSAELEHAGKGVADPTPFLNAIYLATDILHNRENYDEARVNPLPKLFHDKRSDTKKGNMIE